MPGEPKYLNSPGDGAVSQGPRALRPVRDAPRAYQPFAPARRRRLHGHGAPASGRHRLRGGDARHGHDRRASAAPVPPGAARWCSPSTATAPAARPPGARCSRRCPRRARGARSASCSCPRATIRTRSSARKARTPSRRACADAAAAVGIPGARAVAAERARRTPTGARALRRAARPLFAKVPAGVYRELLLERLARGGRPERRSACEELWAPGAPAARRQRRRRPRRAARRRGARGRRARQPGAPGDRAAAALPGDRRRGEPQPSAPGLMRSDEPGVALLRELIDDLKRAPGTDRRPGHASAGADREGGESLQKLLRARGGHYRGGRRRRGTARRRW